MKKLLPPTPASCLNARRQLAKACSWLMTVWIRQVDTSAVSCHSRHPPLPCFYLPCQQKESFNFPYFFSFFLSPHTPIKTTHFVDSVLRHGPHWLVMKGFGIRRATLRSRARAAKKNPNQSSFTAIFNCSDPRAGAPPALEAKIRVN